MVNSVDIVARRSRGVVDKSRRGGGEEGLGEALRGWQMELEVGEDLVGFLR